MRNKAGILKLPAFSLLYTMLVNNRFTPYLFVLALAAWVVICYNPFLLWFQNDDFVHIVLSRKGVLFQHNTFRPICDLSIMLDYYIWGNYAPGYHITNLILHVTCTALVYVFCKSLFSAYPPTTKQFIAFISTALFFAYPFHSEAVFWILGRSATLGTIFSLLFLIFFLKTEKRAIDIILYAAAFTIALLTYESSWVLPLIAFLLMMVKGYNLKKHLLHFGVLGVVFITYLFARWLVIRQVVGDYEGYNFSHFNATVLFSNFFKLVVRSFFLYMQGYVWLCAGFVFMLVFIVFECFKTKALFFKKIFFIVACFIITILPYLSLGINTHSTEGERFLYMPSVFLCIGFAAVFCQIKQQYVRKLTILCLFFLYTVQLILNANNYRFAGSVVKQTLHELAKLDGKKNIVIQQVPQSQYGALIFRSGLNEAAELLAFTNKGINIKVLSLRDDSRPLQVPYKTIYMPAGNVLKVTRYVFTDSALLIYR